MSSWGAAKAKRVLAALLRIGWQVKRESGSHRVLSRAGWPDFVFAFHDSEEIGPACSSVLPDRPDSPPMISESMRSNKRLLRSGPCASARAL